MANSYKDMADQLRVIQRDRWPKAINSMLRMVGEETVKIAQEEVIGRTDPLPSMAGANKATPAWLPLQEATIEAKGRQGLGKGGDPNSILYASGKLAESVEFTVVRSEKKVHIGSDLEYAAVHEYGAMLKNIPPRPFLTPSLLMALQKLYPRMQRIQQKVLNNERAF